MRGFPSGLCYVSLRVLTYVSGQEPQLKQKDDSADIVTLELVL